MTPAGIRAFVKKHGIVLQAARGPVPTLTFEIIGRPFKGSWWGHPRSHEIFRLINAARTEDVVACRLIGGKVTLIHRQLWPALVRLGARFPKRTLAAIHETHTESGAHRVTTVPFPKWVDPLSIERARKMTDARAERLLRAILP